MLVGEDDACMLASMLARFQRESWVVFPGTCLGPRRICGTFPNAIWVGVPSVTPFAVDDLAWILTGNHIKCG